MKKLLVLLFIAATVGATPVASDPPPDYSSYLIAIPYNVLAKNEAMNELYAFSLAYGGNSDTAVAAAWFAGRASVYTEWRKAIEATAPTPPNPK